MKIVIFGAAGMVGQAALKQALNADDVSEVLVVWHSALAEIQGYDACFFCIGATANGMSEEEYTRFTYDFTLDIARALVERNPSMHFIYMSGAGADSTEMGKVMWARVSGKTENALAKLPFKAANSFRPMVIQPIGVQSKTTLYRWAYYLMTPFFPLIHAFSKTSLTSVQLGEAMLNAVRTGDKRVVIEEDEIRKLAK